ncbi:hypothetical protein ABZ863_22875 [Saccharomonospora sp. NPDC046836]|uniref:hypothetical protein n=1 Tax=Saccharomonospora sp. NPDC046836 TaxID=3156921 RepID=UPI0033C4426E
MNATTEPASTHPVRTLLLLRATVVLGTICVLAQPVLAGGYLSGTFDFLGYHESNAHIISGLLVLQAAAGVAYLVAGRGSAIPLVFTVVQFAAVGLQTGMGYSRQLAVHIPLGVFIVLMSLHLCVWVFRPVARLSRMDRKAQRKQETAHEPVA